MKNKLPHISTQKFLPIEIYPSENNSILNLYEQNLIKDNKLKPMIIPLDSYLENSDPNHMQDDYLDDLHARTLKDIF